MKNLNFAQESNETCIKVDILIGLDYYYYNFMTRSLIKEKRFELIALELTLGWIIGGHYSSINSQNVYNINSHFFFFLLLRVIVDMFLKMKMIPNCQRFGI